MWVHEFGDWPAIGWHDRLTWPAQIGSKQARRQRLRAKVEAWFAANMGMTVSEWREAQRQAGLGQLDPGAGVGKSADSP